MNEWEMGSGEHPVMYIRLIFKKFNPIWCFVMMAHYLMKYSFQHDRNTFVLLISTEGNQKCWQYVEWLKVVIITAWKNNFGLVDLKSEFVEWCSPYSKNVFKSKNRLFPPQKWSLGVHSKLHSLFNDMIITYIYEYSKEHGILYNRTSIIEASCR